MFLKLYLLLQKYTFLVVICSYLGRSQLHFIKMNENVMNIYIFTLPEVANFLKDELEYHKIK